MFVNNRLRVVDENIEVLEESKEEENRMTLDEQVMQAISSKQATVAKDASEKESNMSGCFRIEVECECVSACDIAWSRKWGKMQLCLWRH